MIHIAGAFEKPHILIPFIIQHKLKNVCVYGGIPGCEWNGGRINALLKYPTAVDVEEIIKTYHKLNVPVFLTFSNFDIQIRGKPQNIKYLNLLQYGDGVILVNEDFRKFLREEFPHLTLIYSITGHSNDYKDFDLTLEGKYDLIVPRFENIFNNDFLAKANTSKYEIMLNDTCRFGCHLWNSHFQKISEINKDTTKVEDCELSKIQECWLDFNPCIDSKHDCMDLDVKGIKKALGLGYKHFKFTGRENSDDDYLYDLNLYTQRLRETGLEI